MKINENDAGQPLWSSLGASLGESHKDSRERWIIDLNLWEMLADPLGESLSVDLMHYLAAFPNGPTMESLEGILWDTLTISPI